MKREHAIHDPNVKSGAEGIQATTDTGLKFGFLQHQAGLRVFLIAVEVGRRGGPSFHSSRSNAGLKSV